MIYFDNAATSRFKPKCMINALKHEILNSSNGGRSGHKDAINTAIAISNARETISGFLGCKTVIFTKNCTEALNLAIMGTLKKNQHIITTVNEHNSTLRPLFRLERNKAIRLTVVNPDKNLSINPTHIERLINKDTYLIAINAVSNVTGAVSNIEKIGNIAKQHNVMLLVDGAQAIPHITLNMKKMNIDFLACAGHKGLHGPQGTGFLAINTNEDILPMLYGGTGTNSDSVYQPYTIPETLEAGTLNSGGIIALGKATQWTMDNLDKINSKIEQINSIILYGLKNMNNVEVYTPDGCKTGVITFNIKGATSSEIGDILNERYNIAVRAGLHCAPLIHNHLNTLDRGAVRVSVGYNNTEREANILINAIQKIASKY